MKIEPEVGEVIVWDYQRYKTVETNKNQMERECQTYCALANLILADGWPACSVIHCSPENRKDGKFVNFVKLAPRKKRHTSEVREIVTVTGEDFKRQKAEKKKGEKK